MQDTSPEARGPEPSYFQGSKSNREEPEKDAEGGRMTGEGGSCPSVTQGTARALSPGDSLTASSLSSAFLSWEKVLPSVWFAPEQAWAPRHAPSTPAPRPVGLRPVCGHSHRLSLSRGLLRVRRSLLWGRVSESERPGQCPAGPEHREASLSAQQSGAQEDAGRLPRDRRALWGLTLRPESSTPLRRGNAAAARFKPRLGGGGRARAYS